MPALLDAATTSVTTPDPTQPSGVAGWAIDLMEAIGAPGAGIAVALENLFPPIPSEIILPLGGFTASLGDFTVPEVIAWTTGGSVVGAIVLYLLGFLLGRDRLIRVVQWMPLVDVADVERAERWFARHGALTVLLGRMVPLFRSLISIPAGLTRMNLWLFILLTTVGSLIWNSLFVMLGFVLGENWPVIGPYVDAFQYLVLGAVAVAIVAWIVLRIRRDRDRLLAADDSH